MTGSESQAPLVIYMRAPHFMRILFIGFGIFAIVASVWELGAAVWPPNIFSPFFLFIILGAASVGWPMMTGALFATDDVWTVEKGRVTIDRDNWFKHERLVFDTDAIDQFNVVEVVAMEGDNTWKVVMWVRGWKSFETYEFSSKAAAERKRDEILAKLRGQEPIQS